MRHVALAIAYAALYERYKRALPIVLRKHIRRTTFVKHNLHTSYLCSYECCEGIL